MKKVLLPLVVIIIFSTCSSDIEPTIIPEPVVEEIVYEQVRDNGNIYTSKDFFDAGFNEYKEYNISKLTGATEAWYGYWGPDEDSDVYYELRFYPDHSTAVSDGTPFAEDATGEDAVLGRKETMWRVGLAERKASSQVVSTQSETGLAAAAKKPRLARYADYMIFNNVIMLCEGEDSNEAFQLCNDLIDLVGK
jgi:hypothetical protein